MWHVAHDMWQVTCCWGWTISQNVSSLAHTVCDAWYFEDSEEKADLPNERINEKGVYRRAPATPGLLKKAFIFIGVLVVDL